MLIKKNQHGVVGLEDIALFFDSRFQLIVIWLGLQKSFIRFLFALIMLTHLSDCLLLSSAVKLKVVLDFLCEVFFIQP